MGSETMGLLDSVEGGHPFAARADATTRRLGRPHVVLNMVGSVDGAATIEGRSAPLSSDADRELFHHLRELADGVLVGAGTIRAERYGRMIRSEETRARRSAAGRPPEPLAAIVSASLELPPDLPLLAEPDARVVLITPSGGRLAGSPAAAVDYVREAPSMGAALEQLLERFDVRMLLCEGGPHLNRGLLTDGLVDELMLTLSPTLAGGEGALPIIAGPLLRPPRALELLACGRAGSHLFLRYAVAS